MKGDFSRLTFDPRKHYASVLMQQGRVQLDADWNEQQAILAHRIETEMRDLIGEHGAPADTAGFAIERTFALEFDGADDFIALPDEPHHSHASNQKFTVEARIKPRETRALGAVISSLRLFDVGDYALTIEADRTIAFRRFVPAPQNPSESPPLPAPSIGAVRIDSTPVESLAVLIVSTTRPIPANAFSHVAVTFDGHETRIYLDGELAAVGVRPDPPRRVPWPVAIGANHIRGSGSDHFGGIIEDVRLWNVARSADEIAFCRQRGVRGTEAGLVGYWPLDEGDGDLAHDQTGRGHDGILGGGTHAHRPRWRMQNLRIGAGRYYVDGILCENETAVLLTDQSATSGVALPAASGEPEHVLAYLDVWKRHVTACEDPSLSEPALGGADTTTRLQTTWSVRLLRVRSEASEADAEARTWHEFRREWEQRPRLRARKVRAASEVGNQLYRVEIHHGERCGRYGAPRHAEPHVTRVAIEEFGADQKVKVRVLVVDGRPWQVGEVVELFAEASSQDSAPGALATIIAVEPATHTLTLDHVPDVVRAYPAPHLRRIATFKWSRDNGSIAVPVANVDPTDRVVTLRDLGRGNLSVGPGDWVELVDDEDARLGRPGEFLLVNSVDQFRHQVELATAPVRAGSPAPGASPVLRRWDQNGGDSDLVGGLVPVSAERWITLEDGVQVSFTSDGPFHSGDYWVIPARSATDSVEWPVDELGPVARAPDGIQHHFCVLAALRFADGHARLEDRRRFFAPLAHRPIERPAPESRELEPEPIREADDSAAVKAVADAAAALAARALEAIADARAEQLIPAGFTILGPSPTPPPTFQYTGSSLLLFQPGERPAALKVRDPFLRGVVVDDRVYLVGSSGSTWVGDVQTDRVESRAPLRPARTDYGVAVVQGKIYVVGGRDLSGDIVDWVSVYDPSTDQWTDRAALPLARSHVAVCGTEGKLYCFGGEHHARRGAVPSRLSSEYDPRSDRWSDRSLMSIARTRLSAVALRGKIYLLGGETRAGLPRFQNRALASNDEYDPRHDAWQVRQPMRLPRRSPGVAILNDKLYVLGGAMSLPDEPRPRIDTVDEYDPALDYWLEKAAVTPYPHVFGLAVAHGRLLALGKPAMDHPDCRLETIATCFYLHRKLPPVLHAESVPELARGG